MLHNLACSTSERVSRILSDPLFVLLFVPACALVLALGWWRGAFDRALLVETTVLSVLASWQASLVMYRQARDAGEVE